MPTPFPAFKSIPLVIAAIVSAAPNFGGAQEPEATPGLQQRINAAIDRGVDYLLDHQHRDGSWSGQRFRAYKAGPTAFCSYALVESGVSPDSPAIRLALAYLKENPAKMTYAAGSVMMLLAEIHAQRPLEGDLKDLAEDTLGLLVAWESTSAPGSWGYPGPPLDLSNTQFAALGFLAAHRIGLKVPLESMQKIVTTTANLYQEEPVRSPVPLASRGKKRGKKPFIAGYSYKPKNKEQVRSSMTVAGLGAMEISKMIFGRKLGRKALKAGEDSQELAMGWLEANWTLTENVKQDGQNGKPLFYLWGIERLAAFLDVEEFFGFPWYEPGAVVVLELEMDASGKWGQYDETCQALLFLNRATRAAVSGRKKAAVETKWNQTDGDVRFRVTGNMDSTAWLTDLEKKEPVTAVQWFLDGESHAELKSDGKRPWKGERFATRWSDNGRKERLVEVEVTYADGTSARSKPLKIKSTWTADIWAKRAHARLDGASHPGNPLLAVEHELSVSSSASGQDAPRVMDGFEATAWIADGADKTPKLELRLKKPLKASYLTLSHPGSSVASLKDFAGATKIRIQVNKNDYVDEFELPSRSAAPMRIPLHSKHGSKVRLKQLVIEILEVEKGAPARTGFAEIGVE